MYTRQRFDLMWSKSAAHLTVFRSSEYKHTPSLLKKAICLRILRIIRIMKKSAAHLRQIIRGVHSVL